MLYLTAQIKIVVSFYLEKTYLVINLGISIKIASLADWYKLMLIPYGHHARRFPELLFSCWNSPYHHDHNQYAHY